MRETNDAGCPGTRRGGPVRTALSRLRCFFVGIVASGNSGRRQHGVMVLSVILLASVLTHTAWGLCPGMLSESYDHIPGCRARPPGVTLSVASMVGGSAAPSGCALGPTPPRSVAADTAAFRPTRIVAAIDLGRTGAVLIVMHLDCSGTRVERSATRCRSRRCGARTFIFFHRSGPTSA
jgi:hypothetical protein